MWIGNDPKVVILPTLQTKNKTPKELLFVLIPSWIKVAESSILNFLEKKKKSSTEESNNRNQNMSLWYPKKHGIIAF